MHHEPSLIVTIAASFGLALMLGFVAARLKLPVLVGYMVAGILLGPASPGFVADVALSQQLAEIGVILLMFGVGLHFSLEDLFAVRRIALPGALLEMTCVTALGAGVASLWGWSLGGCLVFGLCLSVASTVVLVRSLERAEADAQLQLADDRRGNPTPVDDAARVILAVLTQLDCQAPLWGTYHYGGQEATTALALGQAVLSEARVFRHLLLDEVKPQAHASRSDAADEPQHAVLACKKILHTFGVKPRAWRTALPQLLDRYYRHV